jgi:hypothetical protein
MNITKKNNAIAGSFTFNKSSSFLWGNHTVTYQPESGTSHTFDCIRASWTDLFYRNSSNYVAIGTMQEGGRTYTVYIKPKKEMLQEDGKTTIGKTITAAHNTLSGNTYTLEDAISLRKQLGTFDEPIPANLQSSSNEESEATQKIITDFFASQKTLFGYRIPIQDVTIPQSILYAFEVHPNYLESVLEKYQNDLRYVSDYEKILKKITGQKSKNVIVTNYAGHLRNSFSEWNTISEYADNACIWKILAKTNKRIPNKFSNEDIQKAVQSNWDLLNNKSIFLHIQNHFSTMELIPEDTKSFMWECLSKAPGLNAPDCLTIKDIQEAVQSSWDLLNNKSIFLHIQNLFSTIESIPENTKSFMWECLSKAPGLNAPECLTIKDIQEAVQSSWNLLNNESIFLHIQNHFSTIESIPEETKSFMWECLSKAPTFWISKKRFKGFSENEIKEAIQTYPNLLKNQSFSSFSSFQEKPLVPTGTKLKNADNLWRKEPISEFSPHYYFRKKKVSFGNNQISSFNPSDPSISVKKKPDKEEKS